MNRSSDPLKTTEPRVPEPPRDAGARADVRVGSTTDTTKVSITTPKGATVKGRGWPEPPKDRDDVIRWFKAAIPWIAGAAFLVAAGAALKRANEDEDVTSKARRKARRAGDKVESAWDETKEQAERGWFGLKRNTATAVDEAGDIAARKTNEARDSVREGAGYVKESAKDAGRWASNKAQDAADAAKGTYRSAADTAGRAAAKVEEKVAGAGSAALSTASAVEEKAGSVMRHAGEDLEKDGRASKKFYRGEQVKEEKKNWGCSIM